MPTLAGNKQLSVHFFPHFGEKKTEESQHESKYPSIA